LTHKTAIVAGTICLDIRPDLSAVPEGQFQALLQPGKLIRVAGVGLTVGGAVGNAGLALHQLGIPVRLMGKVGVDPFGEVIGNLLENVDEALARDLVRDPSGSTSFSVILNPPGFDRTFLHAPGVNDLFYASDLPRATLKEADLLHFGYPSLMRSIYRGDGAELVSILQRVRREGLTTSLDFSLPDLSSPAAKVDWTEVLANSLPSVDLFAPSVDELVFMLDRAKFDELNSNPDQPLPEAVTPELLSRLSEEALSYGVKAVLVKLGTRGAYLRTASEKAWARAGRGLEGLGENWHNRELWAPAYEVPVAGTTGAGDAAIAGFLSSVLRGESPETALKMANAVGAACVEAGAVLEGVGSWDDLLERVNAGWATQPLTLAAEGWRKDEENGLWEKA
jgi:sugar/nucleoside kinase (ribokinase family)